LEGLPHLPNKTTRHHQDVKTYMTKYSRHILQLCKRHHITAVTGNQHAAYVFKCEIVIPARCKPNMGMIGYISALHEISHIITRPKNPTDKARLLRDLKRQDKYQLSAYSIQIEIRAWNMAQHLAKWWNPRATKAMKQALQTYVDVYNRQHITPYPHSYV
jgi:hypothetical protein